VYSVALSAEHKSTPWRAREARRRQGLIVDIARLQCKVVDATATKLLTRPYPPLRSSTRAFLGLGCRRNRVDGRRRSEGQDVGASRVASTIAKEEEEEDQVLAALGA
jgi:hypothetical protein